MAAARHKIRSEDVHGLEYFEALRGLIKGLHVVGTERDPGIFWHHRLPIHHVMHRLQAHQTALRDGLLLPLGLGNRRRNEVAYRGTPLAGVILLRAVRYRNSLVRRRLKFGPEG